jgi:hypothetical protein
MIIVRNIKRFRNICIIIILAIISLKVGAQQSEIRMQSVFLYNFTRLVSWPDDYQSGDFVMAVYGDTPMLAEIQELAQTRKAGTQNIVAKRFNSAEEITKCHILYIPGNQSRHTTAIVNSLKAKNIKCLIVSDSRNATKNGAVVNFSVVDGRQRFELSQVNARDMGLTLGGEITRLAIVID